MNHSEISQRSEVIQKVNTSGTETFQDGGDHSIEKYSHPRLILEIVSVEKSGIINRNAMKDLDELWIDGKTEGRVWREDFSDIFSNLTSTIFDILVKEFDDVGDVVTTLIIEKKLDWTQNL